jgi:hypothetical protein
MSNKKVYDEIARLHSDIDEKMFRFSITRTHLLLCSMKWDWLYPMTDLMRRYDWRIK